MVLRIFRLWQVYFVQIVQAQQGRGIRVYYFWGPNGGRITSRCSTKRRHDAQSY